MRAAVAHLPSPHPIGPTLPGLYHNDDFAQRFVSAFDEQLAPVFACLDNLDAYLDPWLAPEDFVDWLAGWVGLVLDENWSLDRRRAVVARAVELYARRGTVSGLKDQIALFTGTTPEIVESGGVAWSTTPGSELPGSSDPQFTVRVRAEDASSIDVRRLEGIVAAAKPAHLVSKVELISE